MAQDNGARTVADQTKKQAVYVIAGLLVVAVVGVGWDYFTPGGLFDTVSDEDADYYTGYVVFYAYEYPTDNPAYKERLDANISIYNASNDALLQSDIVANGTDVFYAEDPTYYVVTWTNSTYRWPAKAAFVYIGLDETSASSPARMDINLHPMPDPGDVDIELRYCNNSDNYGNNLTVAEITEENVALQFEFNVTEPGVIAGQDIILPLPEQRYNQNVTSTALWMKVDAVVTEFYNGFYGAYGIFYVNGTNTYLNVGQQMRGGGSWEVKLVCESVISEIQFIDGQWNSTAVLATFD